MFFFCPIIKEWSKLHCGMQQQRKLHAHWRVCVDISQPGMQNNIHVISSSHKHYDIVSKWGEKYKQEPTEAHREPDTTVIVNI